MINNPTATVVTERGPYMIEASLTRNGKGVSVYTLTIPNNTSVTPMFHADDPRVPDAYDPQSDYWDGDKAFQLVEMWEERYESNGTRKRDEVSGLK